MAQLNAINHLARVRFFFRFGCLLAIGGRVFSSERDSGRAGYPDEESNLGSFDAGAAPSALGGDAYDRLLDNFVSVGFVIQRSLFQFLDKFGVEIDQQRLAPVLPGAIGWLGFLFGALTIDCMRYLDGFVTLSNDRR